MRPSPVKVIRHVSGPSAWISSNVHDPVHDIKHADNVNTVVEPSRDDTAEGITMHIIKQECLAGKHATEITVQPVDDATHGHDNWKRRKVITYSLNELHMYC